MSVERPRIAILYSGQSRSSILNPNVKNDNKVLESTSEYFLTPSFKAKYDYDIFISTDTLDINKAKEYFGDNLKNVHFWESDYYLSPVKTPTQRYDDIMKKPFNFEGKYVSPGNFPQAYRILDVHNLMDNYINETGMRYELIVRTRLDLVYHKNIEQYIEEILTSNEIQLSAFYDQLVLGKPEIMKEYMRSLECKYGRYTQPVGKQEDYDAIFKTSQHYYTNFHDHWWKWSPEIQYTSVILDYCYKNNMNIRSSIKSYEYEDAITIYNRGAYT